MHLQNEGDLVIGVGRGNCPAYINPRFWVKWDEDSVVFVSQIKRLLAKDLVGSVIWAQGKNFNDEIEQFNLTNHLQMYQANVTFIMSSLQALLIGKLLENNARLCVISSIWQNIARQNKLSYCVTKSALQGLIQSLSIDLGKKGMLVNAVLPGALDTEMTRANLSSEQIRRMEMDTPLQSLPNLIDVTGLVSYLCSPQNTGITGQFIAADRGLSNARIL